MERTGISATEVEASSPAVKDYIADIERRNAVLCMLLQKAEKIFNDPSKVTQEGWMATYEIKKEIYFMQVL